MLERQVMQKIDDNMVKFVDGIRKAFPNFASTGGRINDDYKTDFEMIEYYFYMTEMEM
mgnify:CR=1 FL=1